jgi:2-oxoglutarate dehydrogenase E1 component
MSPKILLRHKKAVSSCAELISGSFQPLLDTDAAPDGVERLLLCSGKIYYELEAQRDVLGRVDTAVIRMEQLYPFPETEIRPCLERYGNVREIIWVQEEPRNAGAWGYMREQFMQYFASQDLRYYGREESDSGATASFREFQQEQKKLIEGAFDSETK